MAGMKTTRVDWWWAAQRGLTGELPTYEHSTAQRPAYGSAVEMPASRNIRTVQTLKRAMETMHLLQTVYHRQRKAESC